MAACSTFKSHRDMKRELHRLASFAKSSIHQVTLPSPLASAGLYYIHKVDSVACFICDWRCRISDLYNDPVEQHHKESPRCDAMENKTTGNIPFGSRMVDIDDDHLENMRFSAPATVDIDGALASDGSSMVDHVTQHRYPHSSSALPRENHLANTRLHAPATVGINGDLASDGSMIDHLTHNRFPDSSNAPPHENHQTNTRRPAPASVDAPNVANCVRVTGPPKSRDEERRQRMKHEHHRLATFSDWPMDCPVSKEAVAKAGLYYIGPYDRVRCGFCYNVLKRWESGDIPQVEHKKYFPRCPFTLNPATCGNIPMTTSMETTGEDEAEQTRQPATEDINQDRTRLLTENRELRDARICKICMEREANTVILPCGHLLACGQCALQLTSCPACRQVIKGTVNTYLS